MKKEISMKLKATGTGKDDPSYKITIDFDFSDCSPVQLNEWALANRIVVWQNSNRDLTIEEFKALDNTTMKVSEIGSGKRGVKKPMTVEQMLAFIKNLPDGEKAKAIEQLMG